MDPDFLELFRIHQAELVVSTVHDLETNLVILSSAKREGVGPVVMAVAHRIPHALELYEAGADYVILPHFLGSSHAASLVRRFTKDATEIQTVREEHIAHLQARIVQGHEHPQLEQPQG